MIYISERIEQYCIVHESIEQAVLCMKEQNGNLLGQKTRKLKGKKLGVLFRLC